MFSISDRGDLLILICLTKLVTKYQKSLETTGSKNKTKIYIILVLPFNTKVWPLTAFYGHDIKCIRYISTMHNNPFLP